MNDQAVLDSQNDVEMMKRPHLWPHMLLPLKRWRDGHMDTGMISSVGPPLTIHKGTIWGGAEDGMWVYASPEEAVADGWRVD